MQQRSLFPSQTTNTSPLNNNNNNNNNTSANETTAPSRKQPAPTTSTNNNTRTSKTENATVNKKQKSELTVNEKLGRLVDTSRGKSMLFLISYNIISYHIITIATVTCVGMIPIVIWLVLTYYDYLLLLLFLTYVGVKTLESMNKFVKMMQTNKMVKQNANNSQDLLLTALLSTKDPTKLRR